MQSFVSFNVTWLVLPNYVKVACILMFANGRTSKSLGFLQNYVLLN